MHAREHAHLYIHYRVRLFLTCTRSLPDMWLFPTGSLQRSCTPCWLPSTCLARSGVRHAYRSRTGAPASQVSGIRTIYVICDIAFENPPC
jgi:hypothetical protein